MKDKNRKIYYLIIFYSIFQATMAVLAYRFYAKKEFVRFVHAALSTNNYRLIAIIILLSIIVVSSILAFVLSNIFASIFKFFLKKEQISKEDLQLYFSCYLIISSSQPLFSLLGAETYKIFLSPSNILASLFLGLMIYMKSKNIAKSIFILICTYLFQLLLAFL